MARRKNRGRTRTIGLDLNKMKHEVRSYLLEAGFEVVAELAKRIAVLANEKAPEAEENYYSSVDSKRFPRRRGPNKYGASDSGPIKGNIIAIESRKVPWSYLVMSPAWYSHLVEYGTDAHVMPRKSKLGKTKMVFPGTNEWLGQTVEADVVQHTGSKKKPFLRPAADQAEKIAREILREKGFLKS